jgi:hypothetical protein
MTTHYEWDVETVRHYDDGENDVIDHHFCTSFAEAQAFAATTPEPNHTHDIVLVRDDDNRRAWAYLNEDGTMPEWFEDADGRNYKRVPPKFIQEAAKPRKISL